MRVPESFLAERDSRRDFVGDLDPVLFVGEGGNEVVEALFSFELAVDFFLGEDLRKPGRTIEKMMAAAPGTVVLVSRAIPALNKYFLSHTPFPFCSFDMDMISHRYCSRLSQFSDALSALQYPTNYFPRLGSGGCVTGGVFLEASNPNNYHEA